MDTAIGFIKGFIESFSAWGIGLIAAAPILFIIQLCYYLGYYAVIPRFRNSERHVGREGGEGISVIVLLGDNNWYLENTLPKLLAQDHPRFEIVIVEIGTEEEFSDELAVLKERFGNLVTTRMDTDPRFPISNKMAYNLGIKAASYENVILTSDDAEPSSDKWLSCMAKGFSNGDVVIGYCGIKPEKGLSNKIMRCSRLMMSVRYLSAAARGRPYRGIIHNLGFTRETYFAHKGFNHLNMNLGEDDLFVRTIATRENTSVIMHPHATVRQQQWAGLGWWWRRGKFYETARRFYPLRVRVRDTCELASRLLFFITVAAILTVMPEAVKAGAAGLLLIRAAVVRYKLWRIRRRLGEPGPLGWISTLYDLTEPFTALWMSLMSRIKPAQGVWR